MGQNKIEVKTKTGKYQIIIGKQLDGDLLEFKEVGEVSQKLKLKDIINLINKKK